MYDYELRLAHDSINDRMTGYFESYSGSHEVEGVPFFSCRFYFVGTREGSKWKVRSYYPSGQIEGIIDGQLEVVNEQTIRILLSEEQGGCWNVQHFADDWIDFSLTKEYTWIQVRYVTTDKSYFYLEKELESKQKSYIVMGDIVYISKIEDDWAYCTFFGKVNTSGWIMIGDLNSL